MIELVKRNDIFVSNDFMTLGLCIIEILETQFAPLFNSRVRGISTVGIHMKNISFPAVCAVLCLLFMLFTVNAAETIKTADSPDFRHQS